MPNYRSDIEFARSQAIDPLRQFVDRVMRQKYGAAWARRVREKLPYPSVPSGRMSFDLQLCLKVINLFWRDAFYAVLKNPKTRSLTSEAITIRNEFAHDKAFSIDDAIRALDTFSRLLKAIGASEQANSIAARRDELMKQKLLPTIPKTEIQSATKLPSNTPPPKPKVRKPITEENSLACYELGKKVWQNQTTRAKAADEMEEKGMSQASAFFMVSAAEEMLTGKTYKRALSHMTTRVFLKQILQDFGKSGLQTALEALDGHIQYKSEATNDKCVGQKRLYAEFSKLLD